jgi:hypothetical protein|tara:strand:+ start:66 stop:566 length:501 start_codon:yes stop_codon:yes gene_type:complete
MNRELIKERLETLESVIEKAGTVILEHELKERDPDEYKRDAERFGKTDLFSVHLINIVEKIHYLEELISGKSIDKNTERVWMLTTMKEANRLWKLHHKIITGEVKDLDLIEFEDTIGEYLDAGSKISAIKHYRVWMGNYTGKEPTLRESKDKIDAYALGRKVGSLL